MFHIITMTTCNLYNQLYIVGNIKGYDLIWVIGDEFVQMTFDQTVKQDELTRYYMKENYNLIEFSSCRLNGDILGRLVNNLIRAINQEILLPKFIMAVIDNDLTKNIKYNTSRILGICTEYIV